MGNILKSHYYFKNKTSHFIFPPNFKMPMISLVLLLVFQFWSCDENISRL